MYLLDALTMSKHMPESYSAEAKRLYDKYCPLMFDSQMTKEEKIPKMVEW